MSTRRNSKDRKTKVEQVVMQANALIGTKGAALAWIRLCNELEFMIEPEARMPRFNGLLRAVWVAATNEQS